MLVHVTRTAVCMGDDAFDNSRDIVFSTSATAGDIISVLNANSFFPHVSGNDVMWAILNSRGELILEYYTKSGGEVFKIPERTRLDQICKGSLMIHCVYHSNYRKG